MPFAELVDLDLIATRPRPAPAFSSQGSAARPATARRESQPRPTISGAMYARRLEETAHAEALQAIVRLCGIVPPADIENLIRRAADIKARYLAVLLDVGQTRGIPQNDRFKELEMLRSWSQELDEGIAALKAAIVKGDVKIQGIDGEAL